MFLSVYTISKCKDTFWTRLFIKKYLESPLSKILAHNITVTQNPSAINKSG